MSSPDRIAANRRNAAQSTGPRTPEGKLRVAANAVKHGFYAAKFAIPGEARKGPPRPLMQSGNRFVSHRDGVGFVGDYLRDLPPAKEIVHLERLASSAGRSFTRSPRVLRGPGFEAHTADAKSKIAGTKPIPNEK